MSRLENDLKELTKLAAKLKRDARDCGGKTNSKPAKRKPAKRKTAKRKSAKKSASRPKAHKKLTKAQRSAVAKRSWAKRKRASRGEYKSLSMRMNDRHHSRRMMIRERRDAKIAARKSLHQGHEAKARAAFEKGFKQGLVTPLHPAKPKRASKKSAKGGLGARSLANDTAKSPGFLGSWYKQSGRHSAAARGEKMKPRARCSTRRKTAKSPSRRKLSHSWFGEPRRHAKAAKHGWKNVKAKSFASGFKSGFSHKKRPKASRSPSISERRRMNCAAALRLANLR